jgi:DNA anti-recombination protein RmuC
VEVMFAKYSIETDTARYKLCQEHINSELKLRLTSAVGFRKSFDTYRCFFAYLTQEAKQQLKEPLQNYINQLQQLADEIQTIPGVNNG